MLDPARTNEPIYYYGGDQLQRQDGTQLRDVEERHGEIQKLENDIVQLHEINRDFAEIVVDHGILIDNIESSVLKTETHVGAGVKNLAKTVELQSAVRRKRIICGLILFIVIAIAVIVTVVLVVKHKS